MVQGVMAGVSFRYTEEKFFGLIGELTVEQRGWSENFEETDFKYSRKLTYIQMPLLTHIYFGGEKVKGFVNLAFSVSIWKYWVNVKKGSVKRRSEWKFILVGGEAVNSTARGRRSQALALMRNVRNTE